MKMEKVKSPCISQCKLVNGICTGCGRTLDHIKNWSRYTASDIDKIIKHLGERNGS